MKNKKQPRYAIVNGYWKDDESTFEDYVIKLTLDVNDEDYKIFFYCRGEHDLKAMIGKESKEDFILTKYELTNEI